MSLKIERNMMPSFQDDLEYKGSAEYEIKIVKGLSGDMHVKFRRSPEIEIIAASIIKERLIRILDQNTALKKSKSAKLSASEREGLTSAIAIIKKFEISNEYMLRLYAKKQLGSLNDTENKLLALYEDDFIEQYPELKAKDDTAKGDA
jgi:hypothetical protein